VPIEPYIVRRVTLKARATAAHRAHAQSLQRHMIKGARIAISHAPNESLAPRAVNKKCEITYGRINMLWLENELEPQ
jgi:hypothetical protein